MAHVSETGAGKMSRFSELVSVGCVMGISGKDYYVKPLLLCRIISQKCSKMRFNVSFIDKTDLISSFEI